MRKNILLLMSLTLALFSLVGCGKDTETGSKDNDNYEIDLGYYN